MKRNRWRARALLDDALQEMERQDRRYPWPRTLPHDDVGIGRYLIEAEKVARHQFGVGRPSWLAVLAEEVGEAARETDPEKRVTELVQVAAVALSWAQAIEEGEP